jgi:hypothetical protein
MRMIFLGRVHGHPFSLSNTVRRIPPCCTPHLAFPYHWLHVELHPLVLLGANLHVKHAYFWRYLLVVPLYCFQYPYVPLVLHRAIHTQGAH